MGAPQQQAKVLRIGIIQGGKITEERLISRGETVTIGADANNTFVLSDSQLPKSFPLFVANNKGYALSFNDKLQGKVSVKGAVLELDALRERKETRKEKGNYVFPLSSEMRGKVTLNDVSILFQFVPPPVAAVGGSGSDFYLSWRSRVDWVMAGVFFLSFFVHFALVAYVRSLEPPPEPTFTEIPDQFVKLLKPPKAPEPPPVEDVPAEAKEEKPTEEKPKDDKPAEDKPKETKPKTVEQKKAEAKEKVKSKGLLKVLGARAGGNTQLVPAASDIMAASSGDLDKFLESDASLAKAGTGGGLRTGEYGHAPIKDVDGPEIATKEVNVDKRKSSGPKASIEKATDVVGSLDAKKIQSAVGRYNSQAQACHTRALNKNPNISGRVVVSLVVDPSGEVLDVIIVENTTGTQDVPRCLVTRIKRWKFPKFEGDIAQFSLPFLFTASG